MKMQRFKEWSLEKCNRWHQIKVKVVVDIKNVFNDEGKINLDTIPNLTQLKAIVIVSCLWLKKIVHRCLEKCKFLVSLNIFLE